MAFPFGAVAGALAATGSSYHNHNELRDELDLHYYEDLQKLKDNQNAILEHLKESFKANVEIIEDYNMQSTIYKLRFKDINIGIMLDNTMIINVKLETSCRYAYDLVMGELNKVVIERYSKEKK